MKLVIVAQDKKQYMFTVPADKHIRAGDILILDTVYGEGMGTAMCNDFTVNDSEVIERIMTAFTTTANRMRPVTGKAYRKMFSEVSDA